MINFKKLKNSKIFKIILFLLILFFTFILRAHNYEKTPSFGQLEEQAFAWAGINLVETGVPVSWSTLDYPSRAEVFRGKIDYFGHSPEAHVRLYKPWLDQPPLFSLLVGESAHLLHADRNQIIPSSFIRIPAIFLALLTSVMVFLIARLVSGYWMGILSMFIYGTVPLIVFASRLAVPENLIALTFITMVYLILRFNEKPKFLWLISMPLLVGIAGLSKATGFLMLPLALFFVIKQRQWGSVVYLILMTLPFIAAFFWYGLHFDSEIFWRITTIQSQRPVGFSSLAYIFSTPAFDISSFIDSWFIFGLLCSAFYIFLPGKDEMRKILIIAFVYWLAVVMVSGGEQDLLPWYRFPSYSLMAIFTAWGLTYLVKEANFFTSFLAGGMLLGNRYLLVNAFRENIKPLSYRLILGGIMLPSILEMLTEKGLFKKITQWVIVGVIVVGVYFNIIYIYNAFEIACESQSCPVGPSTKLSEMHLPILWRFMVLGNPDRR